MSKRKILTNEEFVKAFEKAFEGVNFDEQPAQDQSQPCPNCESLSKQVTALKTCLEVERGFREQEQPVISGKWAWVPVDPSWAMLIAGNHGQPGDFSAKKVWGDMIAALERSFDYRRPDDPPKTSPQPAQQQEPVYFCDYGYEGWGKVDADMAAANLADGMTVEAYYTSPPASKPWMGLTDEEIRDFLIDPVEKNLYTFARFVETKLREKNHG